MPRSRVIAVAGSDHVYRNLGLSGPDVRKLAADVASHTGAAIGDGLIQSA